MFLLYEGKVSQPFSTKKGLKLDELLGNLLFNIYINDLTDFLNKENNCQEDQLHIPKHLTLETCLHLIETIIKPITLYA